MTHALAALVALFVLATPARAETLLLTLSAETVTIASNYQGADVTLFGAALDDKGDVAPLDGADLVLTARGPAETLWVREKSAVGSIWLNREGREFRNAPRYLSVLSTRPVWQVADFRRRAADEIGLNAVATARIGGAAWSTAARNDSFSAALRRIQERRSLWSENPEGVSLVGGSLFKGTLHLPALVPFGRFEIEARLLRDGETVAVRTIGFDVVKAGFEARAAEIADQNRLAYGLATVALALLFGWLASVIFRRD